MPPRDQTPVKPVHRTRIMMWVAMLAIVLTVVVSVFVSVRPALLLLSGMLLAFAVIRAVSPAPGPYGIAIRSRVFDITLLVAGALVIAVLTLTLQTSALG